MSEHGTPGSVDELSGLFAQERVECEQELAAMDPSELAAQAMASAGLGPAPAEDALDLELQDLFSVERAQVMQEAQAAMLPVAPGLGSGGLAAPTLLSRVPVAAKWGLGLSCAAGLAVVTSAALEGTSPVTWTSERARSAAAWVLGPTPTRVAAPRITPEADLTTPFADPARAPRLVPKIPKAVTLQTKKPDATVVSLEERLRRLEMQAQKAWRAKDLRGAEQKFNEIVALAPQSAYAHWAWGDLFLLAKQSKDLRKRRGLWNRYLQVHPKGRFADAAFAGLCASSKHDAGTCWAEYLNRFPNGAFVKEAKQGQDE